MEPEAPAHGGACPLPRRLVAPAPFDLGTTLDSGQAFRWRRHGSWFSGFVAGEHVRLRLVDGVLDGVASGPLDAAALRAYVRADVDLAAVGRALAFDPHVAAAMARYPGLRILRQDPWETLVSFVLSSVSNIPKIARTVEALAAKAGTPKPLGGTVRHAFPEPRALARLTEAELRATSMGFRAKPVRALAALAAAGDLDLDALRNESYAGAVEVLTALPGVGRKVADCVLLFAYDHPPAFPIDVWVRRGLRRLYRRRRESDDRLRAWAARRWDAWAGYAQQALFHAERLRARSDGADARPGNTRDTPRGRAAVPTTVK